MIYVTSDIHGKFDCLKKLLNAAEFGEDDWLWIIGDVIDRNADGGVRILKWLLGQPNVQLILGNHESMLLSNRWLFEEVKEDNIEKVSEDSLSFLSLWMSNGGEVTLDALGKESAETRQDILDYLYDCPLYEDITVNGQRYILVHGGLGGFEKGRELDDYTPEELLWTRLSLDTEYSPSEFVVIVGHTPTIRYGSLYKYRMIKTDSF